MAKTRASAEQQHATDNLATNAWHDYVDRAVSSIYPNLRQGYDYVWGRRAVPAPADPNAEPAPLADPEMLHWSDKLQPADMTAIQAKAQEYAEQDPVARQEPEAPPPPEGGVTKGRKSRAKTEADEQGRVADPSGEGRNLGDDVDAMTTGPGSPVQRTEEDKRREEEAKRF